MSARPDKTSPFLRRDPNAPLPGAASGNIVATDPAALVDFTGDSIREAESRSAALIAEAGETARQMIEQARAAVAADREAAWAAGYEAGYGEGLAAADRDTAGVISAAEEIAANVIAERDELIAGSEQELVNLALHMADRVLDTALELEPELVLNVFRGALRRAFHRERVHVLCHPEDLELLRQAGPAVAHELGGVEHLQFIEERRMSRGGVIIRTPAGEVVATADSKRDRLAASLAEVVSQRRARGDASGGTEGA